MDNNYGLPPRVPSPSLLENCQLPSSAYVCSATHENVPVVVKTQNTVVIDLSDDDEDFIIPKVENTVVKEEESSDDEVEYLGYQELKKTPSTNKDTQSVSICDISTNSTKVAECRTHVDNTADTTDNINGLLGTPQSSIQTEIIRTTRPSLAVTPPVSSFSKETRVPNDTSATFNTRITNNVETQKEKANQNVNDDDWEKDSDWENPIVTPKVISVASAPQTCPLKNKESSSVPCTTAGTSTSENLSDITELTGVVGVTFTLSNGVSIPVPLNVSSSNNVSHQKPSVSDFCQTGESIINGEPIKKTPIDITTLKNPIEKTSRTTSTSTMFLSRHEHSKNSTDSVHSLGNSESANNTNHNKNRPELRSSRRYTLRPPPVLFHTEKQLIRLIKSCKKCNRVFVTRRDGASHQKKEHKLKHCPVCFNLLCIKGNTWKDHLILHHAVDKDEESAACPFCKNVFEFGGMYQHIIKMHFQNEHESNDTEDLIAMPLLSPNTPSKTHNPQQHVTPTIESVRPLTKSVSFTKPNDRHHPYNKSSNNNAAKTGPPVTRVSDPLRKEDLQNPSNNQQSGRSTTAATATGGPTQYTIPKINDRNQRISHFHGTKTTNPVTHSSQSPSSAPSNFNNPTSIINVFHKPKLLLYYQQNRTPDSKETDRISKELNIEHSAVRKWFDNKYKEDCMSKSKAKRKRH